jgi:hypothetical protein
MCNSGLGTCLFLYSR